jgi:hypothetical protein
MATAFSGFHRMLAISEAKAGTRLIPRELPDFDSGLRRER